MKKKYEVITTQKCAKCKCVIAEYVRKGKSYKTVNLPNRFIDKWGYERNFCKDCMK